MTLNNIVSEVVGSLTSQGILCLIIVNAHGGNYVLSNVVREANAQGQVRVGVFPSREDWTEARGGRLPEHPRRTSCGMH